ncbi:Holliday junction resolvase RuvX [Ignatzschineria rhizosphaerae]|uniref:Putative pre-16S rRNA nuclease n=1 Tax=Ignatzschineria rhizosphaerae TaxID=2923279 RepID=A0ABY3X5B4_9GAMM|nr:Holliday junction resolvase RuvX [Ignatzschineria rhizosphaerae]UNM97090.1 Holliday junction resolvase RuvX [Ignatzschineria rhizosphaerae]
MNRKTPTLGQYKSDQTLEIVLGFDFGTKNLGVAVGNLLTETAQPISILKVTNNQPDWNAIQKLLDDWQPDAFIVGIPYTQDGTETEHIKIIRKFMNRLHGRYGLAVYEVDESYSSSQSEQYLKPSQKGKKATLDAISAAIIVERWLKDNIFS